MPTIRKKSLKQKISIPEQLTDDRTYYLFMGFSLTNDDPKFENDEEARQCWIANKKKLMQVWFDEWKRPGQRPWAWWKWDALERRKRIGVEKWYDSQDWHYTYQYEDSVEFLERVKLLEPFEVKQLPELKKTLIQSRNQMKELGLYFDLGELDSSIEIESGYIDETMEPGGGEKK